MKKLVISPIMLLVVVMGVIYASPYWTLYQLKKAYDNHNATAITRYINFPILQKNLKQQLTSVLIAKTTTLTHSPMLQAFNVHIKTDEIVTNLVNQAVDNTVTPNGVKNLVDNQTAVANLDNNAKLLGGLIAVAMDKIEVQTLLTARNPTQLTQTINEQLTRPNPNALPIKDTASYCGINCFRVQTQVKGYPLTIDMQRQGLVHWQIVGIQLPF